MKKSELPFKAITNGFFASLGLFAFYFLILRLGNGSWVGAIEQFRSFWFWIVLLDFGFGVQIGLYSHLRCRAKDAASTKMAATATGTSALGMVACCAHHLSDLLPLIGLSGAFLFLTKYQTWFIGLGLLSNLLNIIYITRRLGKLK